MKYRSPAVLFAGTVGGLFAVAIALVQNALNWLLTNEIIPAQYLKPFPYLAIFMTIIISAVPRFIVLYASATQLPDGFDNDVSSILFLSISSH
jgi:hypothetical protein